MTYHDGAEMAEGKPLPHPPADRAPEQIATDTNDYWNWVYDPKRKSTVRPMGTRPADEEEE